jgi:nitrate reductase gamma subunit
MSGTFLLYFTYAALAVFALVIAYRTLSIARMPMHLRWELAPVPHEPGKNRYGGSYFEEYEWWTKKREHTLFGVVDYMFKEVVLLKGVWENYKTLWIFTFSLHNGLYLLMGMAALLIVAAVASLGNAGEAGVVGAASVGALAVAIKAVGGLGYAIGTFGAIGLLIMRLGSEKLKPFTTPATLFNLALLAAVFMSGGYALLKGPDFSVQMTGFIESLLTANTSMGLSDPVATHVVIAMFFVAIMPMGFMMHMAIKYFTYHNIRWDDEPMTDGHKMGDEVQGLLGQTVTWSAPHLQTGKADQNWVDIATKEVT